MDRVLLQLVGTTINKRKYAVGRCFVAGSPCLAVKAGRNKHIGTRGDVLNWLTTKGLSLMEARRFLRKGLELFDLNDAITTRFAQGR